MPITTPQTAPASTPTRTRRSKRRPPASPPRSAPRRSPSAQASPTPPPSPASISPSGGSVTFDLYKGADCSAPNKVGATLNATDNPVAANGTFHSPTVDTTTTGAGAYHWIAHYSGDANNNAANGACLDTNENTTVEKKTPGLATQVAPRRSPSAQASPTPPPSPASISPSGGTVTFDLYKGADCSAPNKVGATLNATDNPVAANGTFHSPTVDTTTTGAGAYHWIAHYSGDANNNAANGACLDTNENTTVEKSTPASPPPPAPAACSAPRSPTRRISAAAQPDRDDHLPPLRQHHLRGHPGGRAHQQLGQRQRRLRLAAGHPGRRRGLLLGRDLLRRCQQQLRPDRLLRSL